MRKLFALTCIILILVVFAYFSHENGGAQASVDNLSVDMRGRTVSVRFTDPSASDGVVDLTGKLQNINDNGYVTIEHDGKTWAIPVRNVDTAHLPFPKKGCLG